MIDYFVTQNKPIEIMTKVPCCINLFKNLETGKICGELIVDGNFFGDFSLEEKDIACCPHESGWKDFFVSQFDNYKG